MSTPAEIRARAARIVAQVNAGKSLDALLTSLDGSPQERGLTRTLSYGTIRWQLRLEAMLGKLLARPQAELDPSLRALLLVGLFQLLHSDIAQHAAVGETVEASRVLKLDRASGLVNAVLRRCQREAAGLAAQIDRDPARRTAHPSWLVDALKRDWPNRFEEILNANNSHPPMWLRINARRTSADDYLARLRSAGLDAERSALAPEALKLVSPVDVNALPGFSTGDVSVQDAAAQLAAHLLGSSAGDRVLDACAAPGGKTCHVLEIEPRIGEMIAVDVSDDRLKRVAENLERLDLDAKVVQGDVSAPDTWWDGKPFDRILLDVPCSATGVIRRHPDIKLLRRPSDIDALAERQRVLLRCTWPLLAAGGRLLYSSCSALAAETKAVVGDFLNSHAEARDVTASAWEGQASVALKSGIDAPGLAIYAGQAQMDGFYYACIEKRA